jgi:hypothetical protein
MGVPYVVPCKWWNMSLPIQSSLLKRIEVIFFRTGAGGEPVRTWLKSLSPIEDRKQIGVDIKTVEFGWPIGMPVCRALGDGLYEVRSSLSQNRIARVLFYIDAKGRMVLAWLHQEEPEDTAGRPRTCPEE